MANVYSQQLWLGNLYSSGFSLGPAPPAGFVWVIRDVILENTGFPEYYALKQIHLYTGATSDICKIPNGVARGTTVFHWEGRYVLMPGQNLEAAAGDLGWSIYVSGYQLTLP